MTDRAPRQLLRRDERRAQILRAAAVAFSEAGFAATSVEDVAKQAGITKLIVYRHFASKADLYRAILDEVAKRLSEEFVARSSVPEPRGAGVGSLLAVARELPDGFRLLFVHAAREPEFSEFALEFRDLQTALAEQVLADVIPDEVIRSWATRQLVDELVISVLNWIDCGSPERDHVFERIVTDSIAASVQSWEASARAALNHS